MPAPTLIPICDIKPGAIVSASAGGHTIILQRTNDVKEIEGAPHVMCRVLTSMEPGYKRGLTPWIETRTPAVPTFVGISSLKCVEILLEPTGL